MWAYNSVFYQIYPLGLCGAPRENDGATVHRIRRVLDWGDHLERLGVGAVVFNPIFQSDCHGYDTRDYLTLDCRLGTNEDFRAVCADLHRRGIRVVLDGVFNHVGRGFWAFQDVVRNRENSPYRDWFFINFGGNSGYNDGLWYEGWEGHFELVKLNLRNPQVTDYLFSCIAKWVEEFDIDGLRLDVAYCLDGDFLKALRRFCGGLKSDFFLYGEILGGDYRRILNGEMLPSCTNYECFKGLWSSFNDKNLFEINHSLSRMFSDDPYALYRGSHLFSFADNHDVTRLASNLKDGRCLPLAYAVLFAMPGVPCLYYGSEGGVKGDKRDGDAALRPCLDAPEWNELTNLISALTRARTGSMALCHGGYRTVVITNRQLVFLREYEGERALCAVNLDDAPSTANLGGFAGRATDLISGEMVELAQNQILEPCSAKIWRLG
ncbi:maltodextrin glucosidase [Pseudoflavonifractor sp. BIOML-A14]|nr:maltodextrin glucosidase [Pseudoflavonifractor sp. BIOML-A14]